MLHLLASEVNKDAATPIGYLRFIANEYGERWTSSLRARRPFPSEGTLNAVDGGYQRGGTDTRTAR